MVVALPVSGAGNDPGPLIDQEQGQLMICFGQGGLRSRSLVFCFLGGFFFGGGGGSTLNHSTANPN